MLRKIKAPQSQAADTQLVSERPDGIESPAQSIDGMPEWISDPMPAAAVADESSRIKTAQVKRCVVELLLRLGVGGQQHLETTIQAKAFAKVSDHPTTDAIGRLTNHKRTARIVQAARARQPSQTRADDDCVNGILHHEGRVVEPSRTSAAAQPDSAAPSTFGPVKASPARISGGIS